MWSSHASQQPIPGSTCNQCFIYKFDFGGEIVLIEGEGKMDKDNINSVIFECVDLCDKNATF